MPSLEQKDQKVVFGLDIGTRSVVGTVGYMKDGQFNVIAQAVETHQTRAMLDGQIHDIGKVGMTIRLVKEKLEQQTDIHLTDVWGAAAGRGRACCKGDVLGKISARLRMGDYCFYPLMLKVIYPVFPQIRKIA